MASKNLFMVPLRLPALTASAATRLINYSRAAGRFDLLRRADLEKAWAVTVNARGSARPCRESSDRRFELLDDAELPSGVSESNVSPSSSFQAAQIDDRVLLLENVGESALRQTAVQRHLAAFKSAHLASNRRPTRALVAAARRLAAAGCPYRGRSRFLAVSALPAVSDSLRFIALPFAATRGAFTIYYRRSPADAESSSPCRGRPAYPAARRSG